METNSRGNCILIMCTDNENILPWPCAAVAAAHAEAADRGSSQRLGPPEVSGSHNTLCHGPPYTCGESAGNLPYPAGRGGVEDGLERFTVKVKESSVCKRYLYILD